MGDHWAAHCGLEIVLPNGEVVRTGMDAMPGSNCGQSFQHSFGPSVDGLFSQGNAGIVSCFLEGGVRRADEEAGDEDGTRALSPSPLA